MHNSGINLQQASINLNVSPMGTSRMTSNIDFSSQLRRAMANGAAAAGQATATAAPLVPGAAVMSAVLNNAAHNLASDGLGPVVNGAAPSGDFVSGLSAGNGNPNFMQSMEHMQQNMMSMNMYMIGLQRKFQQMSEQYTTISNVLKTKHDTEKNSISNIR